MKTQMSNLYQLQQFDNRMDAMYKNGLPSGDSARKPTKKQLEYLKYRKKITRKINSSLIRYYQKMRSTNIRMNIVVPVLNFVCQGCFMQVTKSILGDLITGDSVIVCEHCGRLLFITEEEIKTLKQEPVMA
jgi:predicted  nucleic acid-binding Zn-ribbon protein